MRTWILCLLLAGCEMPTGPMKNLGTEEGTCEDFSAWKEVPSPFEGERCFEFVDGHAGGVVCKRADSVFLKACADPTRRPDRKPDAATTP